MPLHDLVPLPHPSADAGMLFRVVGKSCLAGQGLLRGSAHAPEQGDSKRSGEYSNEFHRPILQAHQFYQI